MPPHHVSHRAKRTAATLTLALATGLAVPVVLAGPARAAAPSATAALNGNGREVLYTAAAGQTNKVAVTETSTGNLSHLTYVIDDTVPITAGNGCGHPDSADRTKVSCTVATVDSQDPYSTLTLDVADGDDAVTVNNSTEQAYYSSRFLLGAGKDRLTTTGSVDGSFVRGDAGDDTIGVGRAATVFAGDGNDTVDASGEAALVQGGTGNDVIHGGPGDQNLYGDDGNDAIYAGPGSDLLYGGRGNDVLYGNSGNDQLWGNSGDDKLYGGPGTDRLSGGPGRNVVHQ